MSGLPPARLGALHREDPGVHEIAVDFQPAADSTFAFAWPPRPRARPHAPPRPAAEDTDSTPPHSQDEGAAATPLPHADPHTPPAPRLSRAFSMPLPSQTAHFQHPARTPPPAAPAAPVAARPPAAGIQQFQELARELADSLQTAIQTLLQLSPPQLFDSAKEQFSSCSVQIPTTSISALLTSMKNLNYISGNMHRFALSAHDGSSPPEFSHTFPKDDFDVGELLQSVGDSLGGVAAEAEVDLVLHHGDAGIKHIGVKGDECGISSALTHIIHQVLVTTRPGDSIEVGLSVTGQPSSVARDPPGACPPSRRAYVPSASSGSPVLDDEGSVVCTFDIAHRFFSSSVDAPSPNDPSGDPPPADTDQDHPADAAARPAPQFDTMLLQRLLRHIGGTLRPSLQPRLFRTGRRCELAVTLERGLLVSSQHPLAEEEELPRQYPHVPALAREPTLEELTSFAETLRGKKVAFHASSQGSFAHHLTRYLTAWGMDISHVPTDGAEKDLAADLPIVHADSVFSSSAGSSPGLGLGLPMGGDAVPPIVDSSSDTPEDHTPPACAAALSFIIIDDDVPVLRRRLLQHRAQSAPSLHLHARKHRPPLAASHRPRSSPAVRSAALLGPGAHAPPAAFAPVPIVHFTSLANYKTVKHAIQDILAPPGPPLVLPEVIVIPKPAGPRRLLTALHTAVDKPVVDPFFAPIATAPMSPSSAAAPFTPGRKAATPPAGLARPPRSPRQDAAHPPSSPLALPEGRDYFPDATLKTLGGNAASGLVIQSPDGRPAGIFFQPQSRSSPSRTDLSALAMERERGGLGPGGQRAGRRNGARRADSSVSETSDSATQAAAATSPRGPPGGSPAPAAPAPDRPKLCEPTEFARSFKGKGRVPAPPPAQDRPRASSSSAAWREATQSLAMLNLTPIATPSTDAGPVPAAQPPATGVIPPPSARMPSQGSRSPTSPSSPEHRKSIARRVAQRSKSPVVVSTGVKKKPRSVGNNIVPPISVLIVEDNAINQTILSTFMRRNKIKYEVAWNGREAVDKWRNGNFHLILMDIQMPVMDGIEATKEIRRLEKLEHFGPFPPSPGAERSRQHPAETPDSRPSSASSTPFRSQVIIVALTASSLQSDRVAALAAGCNDFLTKPVTNSWLNDKVIEWGSIKALQMWAELRPEVAKNISVDQQAQAQAVASKLHVPPSSVRKSPLSGGRTSLPVAVASREATVPPTDHVAAAGKPARRSSDKSSSSSDSSREPWPVSSDDETMQDPITEPPAVIQTPEHRTIALPELEPHVVTGEAALLDFLEESKHHGTKRPTLMGQRSNSSLCTSASIASVMHDTGGVWCTPTNCPVTTGATAGDDAPPEPSQGDDGHPAGH